VNNACILVVDDDREICQILHRILSKDKYQVQTSHSVANSFGAIHRKLFDVYLLDYNLPDGTGLDIAAHIRSKASQAPIILLSGYDSNSIALRAEKLQLFDIIEKPFSRVVIADTVKKAIESLKGAMV
jgi:two-component system response regulator HydG